MGRITLFVSDDECPHCFRVKKALEQRDIPYTEISISKHPSKRHDMLSVCSALTVPQVFLNNTHLGGANETIKVLESWEEHGTTALETYNNFVAGAAEPTDPCLQPSTDPPLVEHPPPPRTDMLAVRVPPRGHVSGCLVGGKLDSSSDTTDCTDFLAFDPVEGSLSSSSHLSSPTSVTTTSSNSTNSTSTVMSVLEMTELLKRILPRKHLKYNVTLYKSSFRGNEMVDALVQEFHFGSRDEAAAYALYLQQEHDILHHVVDDHKFQDSSSLFFRLHCDQTPQVLNSYRVWTDRVEPDPMALLKRLKMRLNRILRDHTSSDGKVDYKTARYHVDFPSLDESMCELQKVYLSNLPYETKLAFGINLYNVMILFAFTKVGIAHTDLTRHAFFSTVGFNVGGHFLTFNDLENGVLRANRKAPYSLTKPFGNSDDRLQLAVKDVDCRLLFALNCGAASCPPVTNFTADGVHEELRIVAQAFCGDKKNVRVDGHTLYLSKIFKWYQEDFGGTKKNAAVEMARTILPFLRDSTATRQLKDLIDREGSLKIKYNHYDWTTNAMDSLVFTGSAIKADQKRIL